MAAVEYEPLFVASKSSQPSILAFASHAPYLAAGTAPGSTGKPCLCIYGAALDLGIRDLAATFPSPARFRRLSWSRPLDAAWSSSSLYAGLVAGGLETGDVAIWDPRDKLRDVDETNTGWESEFQVIEEHFQCYSQDDGGMAPPPRPQTPAPSTTDSSDTSGDAVAVWKIPQYLRDLGWDSDDDLYAPLPQYKTQPAPSDTGLVALLSKHRGPVRGLDFSLCSPNLLASGATKGRLLVWDLALSSNGSSPAIECYDFSSSDVSYLSWSPSKSNLIASTSYDGAYLWDTGKNAPLVRYYEHTKGFVTIQWSPTDPDVMALGSNDFPRRSSVLVLDKRCLRMPLKEIWCDSVGISSLSWSPNNYMLIACTLDNKIIVWEWAGQYHTVLSKMKVGTCVRDIQWSKVESGCFVTASDDKIDLYSQKVRPILSGRWTCLEDCHVWSSQLQYNADIVGK